MGKIFILLVLSSFLATANADVLHVPGTYGSIREAIDAALSGDTVLVADGTYSGGNNRNLDYGGKSIVVESESGPADCVIDCENGGRGFIFQSGEDEAAVLRGFTIKNGYLSGVDENGAGIFSISSPTIDNCTITDNTLFSSSGLGGAAYCGGSTKMINCIISENRDHDYSVGGGIYCTDTCLITDSIITENEAGIGGGVCIAGSAVLYNCTVSNNTSVSGGGIAGAEEMCKTRPVISHCTITGNSAYEGWGGGIDSNGVSLLIRDCTITGNWVSCCGGGIADYSSDNTTIFNCSIFGNYATGWSGGIHCSGASPEIINCCIFENTSGGDGGGIFMYQGLPAIINCTLTGNSAADIAGGVGSVTDSNPNIINCILWGNSAAQGNEIGIKERYGYVTELSISYSNVEGGLSGAYTEPSCTLNWGDGMIDANPSFLGGVDGDYYLYQSENGPEPFSPCLNAGNDLAENISCSMPEGDICMSDLTTHTFGDRDTGQVDMGAHYFNPPARTVPAFSSCALIFLMLVFSGIIHFRKSRI